MDPDHEAIVRTPGEQLDGGGDPRPDVGEGQVAPDDRGVPGEVGEQRRHPSRVGVDTLLAELPELVERLAVPALVEVLGDLSLLRLRQRTIGAGPLVAEVVEAGRRAPVEDQRLLQERPLVGDHVDASLPAERPGDRLEEEQAVAEQDDVGLDPVKSGRDAAHDAPRRSEEGPAHLTGQRILVDVGRAEEPPQRDLDQRAQGLPLRRHRAEVGPGDLVELRPRKRIVVLPAVTDSRPREPVGVDRLLHVAGARPAGHGR